MKEILLFTLSSQMEDTVNELGALGVVEIRELNPPTNERIEYVADKLSRIEKAIAVLEESEIQPNGNNALRKKYNSFDPADVANRILISGEFEKRCKDTIADLNNKLKWYQTWGENIDINDFKTLKQKGVHVRLYELDKAALKQIPNDLCIVTFSEKDNKIPVALISRSESERLDFEETLPPRLSLTEIKRQLKRKQRQLEEVDNYLHDQSTNIGLLHDYQEYLQDRLNIRKALAGMGDIEGRIKTIKGYIPHDAVDQLKKKAEEKKWGYQISEPDDPDEVPVYIKNPKWVSIINPVMKFIDIVPGYKEVDVSIYFLVAFALFFAMLVGDAGYGALFVLFTFLFRKKLSRQMQLLMYVLSGATIIWGVMSGTYFGSETIANLPFCKNLIIPEIASFGVDNISFMMHLSFLIGAIHLTIAHSIRVFQYLNSIKALSEIGWIAFVWGLFFVAEKLVLGKALPDWNVWLFVIGGTLVVLFSKEGKTFFSSILSSVANLPLSLINGFSDIVSYVRLFAVGMATATVASSFNNMILPSGVDLSFLGMIMAALALLLGHGLNIILALMAVMVHGIRLNMLEFAGHVGVQFSGEAYDPFKLNGTKKQMGG